MFDEAGSFRSDIEVDELDVPESVRLVVGRRLERLGAEAKRALAAGAVVGRAFSFRLLETISDIVPDALLDVIDEAEAAKVIVPEEREGDVHYSFAHELIRQTLLSSLSHSAQATACTWPWPMRSSGSTRWLLKPVRPRSRRICSRPEWRPMRSARSRR